ncbi:MAG: hypothetical protein ACYCZH_09410 [Sulfuriferula sp.]
MFWLARHPKHELILFDRADQDEVSADRMRVFEVHGSSRCILPKKVLRSETSAEVSDSESVQIVNLYNGIKASLGKPIKAPGADANASLEDKHKIFLRERGLPDNGKRPAAENPSHRVTYCWSCNGPLITRWTLNARPADGSLLAVGLVAVTDQQTSDLTLRSNGLYVSL